MVGGRCSREVGRQAAAGEVDELRLHYWIMGGDGSEHGYRIGLVLSQGIGAMGDNFIC